MRHQASRKIAISDLDLNLLTKAIHHRYGFDFSHYKQASLKRRILLHMGHYQLTDITQLISRILWDRAAFDSLLTDISVPVTEFYRDPDFYAALRTHVIPMLKTYPKLRIWVVGCATGEEAYSLAMLLQEANLTSHITLYASDLNAKAIQFAKHGIYHAKQVEQGAANYKASGGEGDFLRFFSEKGDNFEIHNALKEHVFFFEHDLNQSKPMSHIHFICCRNVFIYFDRVLQTQISKLFYESLLTGGYLALGLKETLGNQFISNLFTPCDHTLPIYRKWPSKAGGID